MASPFQIYRTTVGKKFVMAISGMILVAFVLVHMLGNLLVYVGPRAINDYSALLHKEPALLITGRVILLVALGIHVLIAIQLCARNRGARGGSYMKKERLATTCGAGAMTTTGALVALFVLYHLLHFTLGSAHPDSVPGDVYQNLVQGLKNPMVSLVYVAGVVILCLHLRRGIANMRQSLGLIHPAGDRLAGALVFLIAAGYISIPIGVLARILE